ncbi:macrophage erythroblast attacher, putative [Ichthyophthirius multifiliis]|uniref:Macrophage erythroblast attacher, putative n=1 Tax=Ichthyophthirius multifiliis TaxID=5932 RepID=G0QKJ4_ICHMU|nr:macrophage erythroblast attacher, putative [Ichthyophthirius multifiliis]EGR34258.1 macrophage erythroblast attacher, putative [Ichthyophthirius multifiliis]|eukprot:XP_004039562.1 macrophage erythroblast attacher, putative [Ichthyophthirius multifiliis]
MKLPYEYAVKSFKQIRKQTEKEISSILNTIIQLKKEETFKKEVVQQQIQSLLKRLNLLKEQLYHDYKNQTSIYQNCNQRIENLNKLKEENLDSQYLYHKERTKRLIIEQLTRDGNIQIAKKLCQNYKLEDSLYIEINQIQNNNIIIQSLQNQNIEYAFLWCQQQQSKLNKIQNDFQFKLIQQQYIQLLQKNEISKARIYFQKYSLKYKNTHMKEIQKLFMCILLLKNIHKYPQYSYYFDNYRWNDIINQFKQLDFKLNSITSNSQLKVSLQAGLSTLKTINCCNPKYQCPDKCPICTPNIQKLCENVPSTHKSFSTLICRITNEVMNENNYPMVLNNNQVISQKNNIYIYIYVFIYEILSFFGFLQNIQGIQQMIDQNNIICPLTHKQVNWKESKKIYLS